VPELVVPTGADAGRFAAVANARSLAPHLLPAIRVGMHVVRRADTWERRG
jgi:hypothetical protein